MLLSELRDGLHARIAEAPTPARDVRTIVHRGRRRIALHRAGGVFVALTLVAAVALPVGLRLHGPHAVVSNPGPPAAPKVSEAGWQLHPKQPAGFAPRATFTAIAATTHSFLVAGAQPAGNASQPAIWYSDDGTTWHDPPLPAPSGVVSAIATDGADALAIGVDGTTYFVLGSHDEGRTWHVVARTAELLGAPAAQMGRPFVAGLRLSYAAGSWIASGGGTDGYAAIWTSVDGAHWTQVLDTEHARVGGSVDVTTTGEGGYMAYWATTGWYSSDGRKWGGATPLTVPGKLLLQTIAPGAAIAFGAPVDRANAPTPLLRSADHGRTWSLDARFLHAFPDAVVSNVVRTDGIWVATGTSDTPNRPDAWVSSDLQEWSQLPTVLRGAPGGVLQLVAEHGHRFVLLGTAPELDRYYTLDLGTPADTAPPETPTTATDRFRCTFDADEPTFGVDALPHLGATTDRAEVERVLRSDRARILAAHPKASSITVGAGLGRAWDGANGGANWIVAVRDFAMVLHVASADCPRGRVAPETYEGVPLLFTSG